MRMDGADIDMDAAESDDEMKYTPAAPKQLRKRKTVSYADPE